MFLEARRAEKIRPSTTHYRTTNRWINIGVAVAIALGTGGCVMTDPQAEFIQEAQNREPLDPSAYRLEITQCEINPTAITGLLTDIPAGHGYLITYKVTNLEPTVRQYQAKIRITSDDGAHSIVVSFVDTERVEPGETTTVPSYGSLPEPYRDGFSCSIELWPSLVQMLDDAAGDG